MRAWARSGVVFGAMIVGAIGMVAVPQPVHADDEALEVEALEAEAAAAEAEADLAEAEAEVAEAEAEAAEAEAEALEAEEEPE